MGGHAALLRLLKAKGLHSGYSSPAVPFSASKFIVLDSGVVPKPIRDFIPASALDIVDHPDKSIIRRDATINNLIDNGEIAPVYPYWDIVFSKSRLKRLDLFRRLYSIGLLGLRLRSRARASILFVAKRDGTHMHGQ